MNYKQSARSIVLILLSLSLISIPIQNEAVAQTQGMSITATALAGSDTIKVIGKTVSKVTDVTFRITSPSGSVVAIDQVTPDEKGEFMRTFKVSPMWKENGLYKITAMQGVGQTSLYTLNLRVDIMDGKTKYTSQTISNLEKGLVAAKDNSNKGLSIVADALEGSTTITITGMTDKISEDVTLTVKAPNGNIISVNQISPMQNGVFESTITTGGPLWKQDGMYTVIAQQGTDLGYRDTIEVEIVDGAVIPEFGAIAALILAVAIVSIIAVSARSRLSIMPRY